MMTGTLPVRGATIDAPQGVVGRDQTVDTLRGVACLLLVLLHVHTGVSLYDPLEPGIIWANAMHLLYYLRMPLFTFLSGVVYAYRPFDSDAVKFLKGKARRILLPMFTVGAAYAFMRIRFVGVTYDFLSLVHVKPFEHLWYLEALFIIFLIVAIADKLGMLTRLMPFSISFAVLTYIYLAKGDTYIAWFSLSNTLYLLPFFLTGLAYVRFFEAWLRKIPVLLTRTLFVIYSATVGFLLWGDGTARMSPLFLLSCSLCLLLVGTRIQNPALRRLGHYSYSIYLFHFFFIYPMRKILLGQGLDSVEVHVLSGLGAGLAGPILLHLLFARVPLLATLFLGFRFRRDLVIPGFVQTLAKRMKVQFG